MSDSINNSQNVNNAYKYSSSELSKYDKDNDGELSIFELENIQDEEGLQVLAQELQMQEYSYTHELTKDEQIENLNSLLSSVKDEQGMVSKAWNAIKCFTGIGSSTKKCEQAIEDFKNGKITYEEAENIISGFSTKQKNSVNFAANILTGVVAVAVVGSIVATGGLSLGAIGLGALAGGATKAGLKFADRATNKVEGDALDGKQLLKDSLSGALDGAVSVATMGIGTTAVTAETVAGQTLKQTVWQGVKSGAKAGAISGGVTGAGDYTIEALLEEDVDFNLRDFIERTILTAGGGALAGGAMGGISSGIQYKSYEHILLKRHAKFNDVPDDVQIELSEQSAKLHKTYESNVDEVDDQIKWLFESNQSVEDVSCRAKSDDSTFAKLATKYKNGELDPINTENCIKAIGDGYGSRIQLKSLSQEQSQEIIEKALKDTGISYNQYIDYIKGNFSNLDDSIISSLDDVSTDVINALKRAQTEDFVTSLKSAISSGELQITELNNYGDEISAYFTRDEIEDIAQAYFEKTNQKLTVVTKLDDKYLKEHGNFKYTDGECIQETDTIIYKFKNISDDAENPILVSGAVKDSGYASTQMNTLHDFKNGQTGMGEMQVRGTDLNEFADVEHIPYDIRKGKITDIDTEYSSVYNLIKSMSKDSYKNYNQYLTKVYNWLRLKELGIETSEPILSGTFTSEAGKDITDEIIEKLSRTGLSVFSHKD